MAHAGVELRPGMDRLRAFLGLMGDFRGDVPAAWALHRLHLLGLDERIRLQRRGAGQVCALNSAGRNVKVDAFYLAHHPLGRPPVRQRTKEQKEQSRVLAAITKASKVTMGQKLRRLQRPVRISFPVPVNYDLTVFAPDLVTAYPEIAWGRTTAEGSFVVGPAGVVFEVTELWRNRLRALDQHKAAEVVEAARALPVETILL